jgi:hypothetical protein
VCDVERCAVGRLWGHGYGVREGNVCVMLSGVQWKGYGGYGYGVRRGKVCVQDIDMELCDVMLGKVLCSYVDTTCRLIYIYIYCFHIRYFCINIISSFNSLCM